MPPDGTFSCKGTVAGGSGEYTFTWKAIENATFTSDIHGNPVHGTCTTGQPFSVKLVVQDSAGDKRNETDSFPCL